MIMRNYNLLLLAGILFAVSLTGCKKSETTKTAYDNANILRGGILYNQFYAVEAGYDTASYTAHKYKAKSSFFACRACHGWDYKGQNGQYINRDASSSRAHIANVDLNEVA